MQRDTAQKIANALDVSLFDRHSGDAKYNAQRNLAEKTHYVDSDTLKFFNARVTSCRVIFGDSVLVIIESVAFDQKRIFRFVAFDLTGRVLNNRDERAFPNSAKAETALYQWAESFDAKAHYKARLVELAERKQREIESLRNAAEML